MLTLERLRQILSYDPNTGVFLWKVRPARRIHVGDVAGAASGKGYCQIMIEGRTYAAHRLAWLYVVGELPERAIDHKDGDRANNRFDNLRLASSSDNGANRRRPSTNTSGFKGVYWEPKRQKWVAHIKVRGRHICVGLFDEAEAAHAAYVGAAKLHFGEFARAA